MVQVLAKYVGEFGGLKFIVDAKLVIHASIHTYII